MPDELGFHDCKTLGPERGAFSSAPASDILYEPDGQGHAPPPHAMVDISGASDGTSHILFCTVCSSHCLEYLKHNECCLLGFGIKTDISCRVLADKTGI